VEEWFAEINEAVVNVFHHLDLFKKIMDILEARSVLGFTPVIQGNWEEVFTIPWVEGGLYDTN